MLKVIDSHFHIWRQQDLPWLVGPMGGRRIGDAPYREVAAEEALTVERDAKEGGLVPDFAALASDRCDPARLHPLVREFYEHTARFAMDVWSETYFPSNVALWLLVKTICRLVNQLKTSYQDLVQSEHMAALGRLSAGIGHELRGAVDPLIAGLGSLEVELGRLLETARADL